MSSSSTKDVDAIPTNAGEGKIYRHEAEQAMRAMKAAGTDAKRHLAAVVDPMAAVRKYPLAATGVAAAAGLAGALLLVPSKSSAAARRLRTLERVARAEAGAGAASGSRSSSFSPKALRLAMRFGKPAPLKVLASFAGSAAGHAAATKAHEESSDNDAVADASSYVDASGEPHVDVT